MSIKTMNDLHSKVYDICDQLVENNKLVTTKMVLSVISTIPEVATSSNEENICGIINSWRLSRISMSNKQATNSCVYAKGLTINNLKLKSKKQLVEAKKEIRILKAKIKALNSFYNRQRQEFIMRIEGMLYK